jgi:hypothetical protein
MEAWQERLHTEREELSLKLVKLRNFTQDHMFTKLAYEERLLLADQAIAMEQYLLILNRRIALSIIHNTPTNHVGKTEDQ